MWALLAATVLSALTCCDSVSLLDLHSKARAPEITISINSEKEQRKLARSVLDKDAKKQEASEDTNHDTNNAKMTRGDDKTAEKQTADDATHSDVISDEDDHAASDKSKESPVADKKAESTEPHAKSHEADHAAESIKDGESHGSEGETKEVKDASGDKGEPKEVGHASDREEDKNHDADVEAKEASHTSGSKDKWSHFADNNDREASDGSESKDNERHDSHSKAKEASDASGSNDKGTHHASSNQEEASHSSNNKEKESHGSHEKTHDAQHVADETHEKADSHASHNKAEDSHAGAGHHADSHHSDHANSGHGEHSQGPQEHGEHRHVASEQGHGEHAHEEHGHGGHGDHEESGHPGHQEHGEHGHVASEHAHEEHGHGGHGEERSHHGHQEHGEHGHVASEHAHEEHGHGGHGDHEESGHHGHGHSQGAHAVAVGLIATVLLVPLVLWMALEDGLVSNLTFKMIDTFISIFLAVLWYNCFAQALVTFEVAKMFPYAAELFGLVQVLALYAVSMAVAYQWRDDNKKLITFCCCAAHCIAFSAISFSGNTQAHTSEDFADGNMEPVVSLLFCGLVIAAILLLSMANYTAWRKKADHGKLDHCVEELELDIIGLVGSFLITQSVRQALIGHYPPLGHFFLQLQGQADYSHGPAHESWQRMFMLAWAVSLTILSVVAVPRLDKLHGGWALHQVVHISKVLLIMLVAWGYLLWGQWEFFELLFHGDPMFGNMVFAVCCTLVAMGVLYGMAKIFGEGASAEQRKTNSMIITGIGLVAAWSWEHCFNLAFDVIGQEYQVGYKGLMPKLFLSIVIPAALLPTYVRHIKSRVIADEEREHAEEHGHAHGESHGDSHGAAHDAEKAH
eukprot:TRINITY_DN539_c0_g1_i1.p1 TRINITY_DN539_c0_g1~~TRINITY_DN539_c0_g1_i1.p1  ORF type:complete len:859 (-),score=174.57 TRINITY_DN539_c0_g1_i1:248-2824(-)